MNKQLDLEKLIQNDLKINPPPNLPLAGEELGILFFIPPPAREGIRGRVFSN
jgi:hypothetical protein